MLLSATARSASAPRATSARLPAARSPSTAPPPSMPPTARSTSLIIMSSMAPSPWPTPALTLGGAASFTAANGAIDLSAAANVFNGAVALANTGSKDVTLSYNGPLVLAGVNVATGNLAVSTTAPGNIGQAANTAVVVGG